jgi:hypothetical protein
VEARVTRAEVCTVLLETDAVNEAIDGVGDIVARDEAPLWTIAFAFAFAFAFVFALV